MDDLLVIGGGVMGLMTAYHASRQGARVTVLERGRIGDPMTASYGRTRTFRSDYLDPQYARLARRAMALWAAFERDTRADVLVRCGCMNIASAAVTPDLERSYAALTHRVMEDLALPTEAVDARARFPYLDADLAYLEPDAGVVNLPAVTAALLTALADRGARVLEGVEDTDGFSADAVVITAGHGTNEVLARLPGARLHVPITRDRPVEARYFTPRDPAPYRSNAMPVIAYLDAGIYCHPIVDGLIDKVKVGYYHPPDLPRTDTPIDGVDAFIERCLPGLADAASEPVADTDGCDYDLVADDEFVLGPVPGVPRAHIGVGWRGTGYKFAPWVGKVLADLALHGATDDDISRFDPARFTTTTQGGPGSDGTTLDPDTAAASL